MGRISDHKFILMDDDEQLRYLILGYKLRRNKMKILLLMCIFLANCATTRARIADMCNDYDRLGYTSHAHCVEYELREVNKNKKGWFTDFARGWSAKQICRTAQNGDEIITTCY